MRACAYTHPPTHTHVRVSGPSRRWDEAHFGKFAAYYVNRTWYFDVHPPLGKLLLGAVAAASGFNGSYDFTSSAPYPPDVPYLPLRAYCAVLSAAAVPLVYGGCRRLGLTRPAAVAAAAMVLGGTP
jgi:dolichyl-phosphate-mannose-protein mannosyltransferase